MAGADDVDRAVAAAAPALAGRARRRRTSAPVFCTPAADALQETARRLRRSRRETSASARVGEGGAARRRSRTSASTDRRSPRLREAQHARGLLLSYTLKEPAGVCAQIVRATTPLMLATWKLAPASPPAARSAKPDPATPARFASRSSRPRSESRAASSTSSPATGRRRYEARLASRRGQVAFTGRRDRPRDHAPRVRPAQARVARARRQEPELVFADADIDDASSSVEHRPSKASGEARSRVLVEKPLYDEFVSRFAEAAKSLKVGILLDAETQVGSRSRALTVTRCTACRDGRDEGAEVVTAAARRRTETASSIPDRSRHVENRMVVAQEEIFGPVVTVIPFGTRRTRIANDVKYGLFRDRVDRRPGARPPARRSRRDDRRQHAAVHRLPGDPVRRKATVRVRP